jgi:hypothetical protein
LTKRNPSFDSIHPYPQLNRTGAAVKPASSISGRIDNEEFLLPELAALNIVSESPISEAGQPSIPSWGSKVFIHPFESLVYWAIDPSDHHRSKLRPANKGDYIGITIKLAKSALVTLSTPAKKT